ncbi:MAG: hypothetical protein E7012_01470 [Alphaproteobacteria bacterium]|nr:hypothetical protein [Alphaproteobacteria bacterium]
MTTFHGLIMAFVLIGSVSAVQIISKQWLFTLEQIKSMKIISRLTNLLFLGFIIFWGKGNFSADEMICLWVIWIMIYIIQKKSLRVSYEILAEFLMENPRGIFIPQQLSFEGELYGDLLVNGVKMKAIAYGGVFFSGEPVKVSIFVELDIYGNIDKLLVNSIK